MPVSRTSLSLAGRALYFGQFNTPTPPANHARFTFLDPRGRQFAPNWEQAANDIVAMLRAEATDDAPVRETTWHTPQIFQDLAGRLPSACRCLER
ncbi:hypothetical protein [Pseudarthrobacter sp. H2]|uniref:MmyB family transcriptional regulator n=1 Tax=Pseudarthrobacter sp. H2 TaxID=3418415 RepID=UPI003CF99BBD